MTDLEMVTQYGWALEYIKQQTPEICMAAVTQYGYALKYVEEKYKTKEFLIQAVLKNTKAIKYL